MSAKSLSNISSLLINQIIFFFTKSISYPLKKCDFLDFEKCCFLRSKKSFFTKSESIISSVILIKSKQRNRPNKVFLSLQSQKALFLGLVWSNLNKEKIGIFWPKAWVNPFEKKCDFLDFEKLSFYSQKRFLFSLQTKKALFLVLFDQI